MQDRTDTKYVTLCSYRDSTMEEFEQFVHAKTGRRIDARAWILSMPGQESTDPAIYALWAEFATEHAPHWLSTPDVAAVLNTLAGQGHEVQAVTNTWPFTAADIGLAGTLNASVPPERTTEKQLAYLVSFTYVNQFGSARGDVRWVHAPQEIRSIEDLNFATKSIADYLASQGVQNPNVLIRRWSRLHGYHPLTPA